MGLAVYLVCPKGNWEQSGMVIEKSFWIFGSITIGLVVFFASSFFLKCSEFFSLLDIMKGKGR
jgi:hypothetical protein